MDVKELSDGHVAPILEFEAERSALLLLNMLQDVAERRVLQYSLGSGDDRSLVLLKAEADGGRKLIDAFSRQLKSLRAKTK